jgi:hypothetical protein
MSLDRPPAKIFAVQEFCLDRMLHRKRSPLEKFGEAEHCPRHDHHGDGCSKSRLVSHSGCLNSVELALLQPDQPRRQSENWDHAAQKYSYQIGQEVDEFALMSPGFTQFFLYFRSGFRKIGLLKLIEVLQDSHPLFAGGKEAFCGIEERAKATNLISL